MWIGRLGQAACARAGPASNAAPAASKSCRRVGMSVPPAVGATLANGAIMVIARIVSGDLRVREKELRIALVCFGGVSLAVYMHGIIKEVLKLARASSAVHGIIDRAKRRTAHFFDVRDENDPEYDTEGVYFDLLRDIGRTVELRVIVDIIAGASAG